MKFPYTTSYAEVFAIVQTTVIERGYSYVERAGQAACNRYTVPAELTDRIYQMESTVQIAKVISEHFHREDYQQ